MNKYYLLIIFAVLLYSVQFVFVKVYQEKRGDSLFSSILLVFISSLFFAVLYFFVNRFKVEFTRFSFIVAVLYALNGICCTIFEIKVLQWANLSVNTLFLMLGAMFVPFIYGLFVGEKLTLFKILAVVLITISLFINFKKDKRGKINVKLIIGCFMVFLTSGMSHVLAYIHQGTTYEFVSSSGLLLLSFICRFILSGIVLLSIIISNKNKTEQLSGVAGEQNKRIINSWIISISVVVGYALVSGIAQYLNVYTSSYVEASIKSTIITGGCIFMSAVFGLLFGEKVTLKKIIHIILVLIGVVLMMI